MPDDKIFAESYVRTLKSTKTAMVVHGVSYPNIRAAVAALRPVASEATILRWIAKGITPEDAFARVPNPGFRKGIIYCITHKASGKQYVGLTIQSLERRWKYHQEQAAAGYIKGDGSLHAAIREFGGDAFEMRQIDAGCSKVDLEAKERQWIATLNTVAPHGYNLDPGGVSGGSNTKPVTYGGKRFPSVHAAALYLMQEKGIGYEAAKKRLSVGRPDVKKPAKPGESLVKTKLYKTWSNIIHGATNPGAKDYIVGASVCDAWKDFDAFRESVGDAPEGMCFARKDKNKPYCPSNCAWMTKSEASKINAAYMKAMGLLTGRKRGFQESQAI